MPDTRYHACGAKFQVTWEWNGLIHYPVKLDSTGEETDDWTCPGCGEYMYQSEMLSSPPDQPKLSEAEAWHWFEAVEGRPI